MNMLENLMKIAEEILNDMLEAKYVPTEANVRALLDRKYYIENLNDRQEIIDLVLDWLSMQEVWDMSCRMVKEFNIGDRVELTKKFYSVSKGNVETLQAGCTGVVTAFKEYFNGSIISYLCSVEINGTIVDIPQEDLR